VYKLTAAWGWLNAACAAFALVAVFIFSFPEPITPSAIVVLALMQAAVSFALIYASGKCAVGEEIGEKIYPASLVAYLLFFLILARWLGTVL
jgi:hypothetical protein